MMNRAMVEWFDLGYKVMVGEFEGYDEELSREECIAYELEYLFDYVDEENKVVSYYRD